jgi:cysteinyl-tRNA synthetase
MLGDDRAASWETIDIHAGGLDLIFPHHENELAQSRCAHAGAPLARYWVHNGFLSMAGAEKMSKSLGNVVTVGELLSQGIAARCCGWRCCRRIIASRWNGRRASSRRARRRWIGCTGAAADATPGAADQGVLDALADDLNTPLALSRLSGLSDPATLRASGALLGLFQEDAQSWFQGEGDVRIDEMIAARAEAKKSRNFAEADRIRAELAEEGVLLEDSPSGTTWRRA